MTSAYTAVVCFIFDVLVFLLCFLERQEVHIAIRRLYMSSFNLTT